MVCGPTPSWPWNGVATANPSWTIFSRTGTFCASANEKVTVSLTPSPVGEITGSDARRPARGRATSTAAPGGGAGDAGVGCLRGGLASAGRGDDEPVAPVGQNVRSPEERVRARGPG